MSKAIVPKVEDQIQEDFSKPITQVLIARKIKKRIDGINCETRRFRDVLVATMSQWPTGIRHIHPDK